MIMFPLYVQHNKLVYTPRIGFETAGIRHEGESCYASCGRWDGRCGYCGNNGYCCKKDQKGCGCDGEMGVAGKGYVCTEKLATGKDITIIIINLIIPIDFLIHYTCLICHKR